MPFFDSSRGPSSAMKGPRRRPCLLLPALLLVLLAGTPALLLAQEEEDLTRGLSELDVHLNKGKELFSSLKFPEAIAEFSAVVDMYQTGKVQDVGADVLRKVAEALDYRARAYFNQGDRERARADFTELLRVSIDYQIDEKMVSPKVVELFKDVRKENVGSLSVVSDPPGAEVFLGDVSLGGSPVLGRTVLKGAYKLRLVMKGYDEYSEDLEVAPHAEMKREVHLRPNRRTLQFITQPAGVKISVDGEMAGTTFGTLTPDLQALARDAGLDPAKASAPLLVPGVTAGEHLVTFEKECYQTAPRKVTVSLDLEHNTLQTFTPVLLKETLGQLQVISHPSGAEVFVDGRSQGTTPLQQAAVCAGERDVRLVKNAEGSWFARIQVKADVLNTLDVKLRPTLLYLGTFRLDSWGRLNWSDEDKLLQEKMTSLASVNQVRPSDDLKAFREALVTDMTRPEEVEEVSKGKGIPPTRVAEALAKFQADLLMAVFTVEENGKGTSTLFLYSSEQPEPDRVAVDLTRRKEVDTLMDRFDRVPDQSRPWLGAAFADTLLGEGPVVVRVVKGGPAAAGGLLPGDQVLSFNGKSVSSARELAISQGWKEKDHVVFGVKRDGPVQSISVTVGSTPILIPLNSPEILYNKALCDYRQLSRGGDDPLQRALALLNLGITFMHFRSYDKALSEALNLANLPAGAGISRGTVRYYQGLCYQKKELVPEAKTAFQDAAAAADATLESNDGPPVATRARKLLQ